jgi:L-ribulose-5-phosphate 4-epimerase
VDLPHHLYLYQHRPEIGGVIHTHSNYATAFALLGRSIPVYLTAIADEFGAEVPCAPYVDNIGDHIGETILKYMGKAPAILLAQHGVFSWGPTPRAALKSAVMLEDVAKTCFLAMLLGEPKPLPPGEIQKWYNRYHSTYGQEKKS